MRVDPVEGNRQWLDGGGMFGHVPYALWSKWVSHDEMHRVELAGRCLLVRTGQLTLLLDAGIGLFFEPKLRNRYGVVGSDHQLLDNLRGLGVQPEEIDAVILSHLHFDHVGGLVSRFEDGPPRLVFPRAKFCLSKPQWERAHHPTPRDRVSYIPMILDLLKRSGRLQFVEPGPWPLDGRFDFQFSEGHTPGLIVTRIWRDKEPPLCFATDIIPGTHWVHLPVVTGYDRYAERTMEEKRAILDWAIEHQAILPLYHDAAVSAIRIEQEGNTYNGLPVLLNS
jgi:glyoxylase-like metal-dependent hydrolase (beta-lactamase superfamily II)